FEQSAAFGGRRTTAAGVPATNEHAGRLRGVRILLVEDNEVNQQIATELLESADASVRSASDGAEAVRILSEGPDPPPFEVVLSDSAEPVDGRIQVDAHTPADPPLRDPADHRHDGPRDHRRAATMLRRRHERSHFEADRSCRAHRYRGPLPLVRCRAW